MRDSKHIIVDATEEEACADCLRSGDLSGTGASVDAYENALAEFFGVNYAVACSSGSTALHLALVAAGVGPGDEVIVPPTAPAMTALPIVALGAVPAFVDTQSPRSFALSLDAVEDAITTRTCAVVSVPMWGYPSDAGSLAALTRRYGIPLIEDAAQAHGASGVDGFLGAIGDIGTFSTHSRKLIATGEGGFCLTNDGALVERLLSYRNFGQCVTFADASPAYIGGFAALRGHNFKLAGVLAAVGRVQIQRLQQRLADRTAIASVLNEALDGHNAITPYPTNCEDRPNYYGYLVHTLGPRGRELGEHLQASGFVTDTLRYHYSPLYECGIFRQFAAECPAAEELIRTVVALPCHEGLAGPPTERLAKALASFA